MQISVTYICKRSFNPFDGDNNNRKVPDHCHLTGDFRGAAHSICNLNLHIDPEKGRIPVELKFSYTYKNVHWTVFEGKSHGTNKNS